MADVAIKQLNVGNPNRILQSDANSRVIEVPKRRIFSGPGQTIGATSAVVASVPLVNGYSYALKGWVIGREATTGDTIGGNGQGNREALAKRVGGTSSIITPGLSSALLSDPLLSLATADFVLGTNTADLQVTGDTGLTINWWGEIEVLEFAP